MSRNGLNIGHVLHHPIFLATFAIAVPAWIIAFVAQCAAEARIDTPGTKVPVVRFLWYNIWIQLACIIHLFMAVCTDGLAVHRFQLSIVLAIAEVFAVYGAEFIFSTNGALIATGVGWLLLALVDLIWILYLTSEEDSPFYRIFTAGGNGGLSSYNRRARVETANSGFGESTMPKSRGYGYSPTAVDTTPQKAPREEYAQPVSQEVDVRRAKAMYAYQADPADPNEVSFEKGAQLEVLDATGKWFQVRTQGGQTGIAPSNYLTLL